MSGWDQILRLALDEPWEAFWVDLYEDPPMGAWIDLQEASAAALANPTPGPISKALGALAPLIAAHNLVDRTGEPLDFSEAGAGRFSLGLYAAVANRILREIGGAPAGPLPRRRGTSPGRSSRRRKFPSGSSSGVSPAT